ncbi:hypothetical protein J132_09193 [Termitomyces sp. J132]|nr:hypothetical protein J132_09193 [Termitomyces sp. J132]
MNSLPYPLFPLICISACTSTLTLIFSTLIISVSPVLWILPALFLSTVAYHAVTILISNSETTGSLRLFSLSNLAISCVLTCLWAAGCGATIAITVLLLKGRLSRIVPRGTWSMIVPCICALLESIIMGSIVTLTWKERKRIQYADKWKWRPGRYFPFSAQWGYVAI